MNYPLRMSSSFWRIPLLCVHTSCTPHVCGTSFSVSEQNNILSLSITSTSNEVCLQKNEVESTFIHLASYDLAYPTGLTGLLQHADDIVIPSPTFTITATFPMEHSETMTVSKLEGVQGFSLRTLLFIVQRMYQDIYRIEEETSPVREHVLYRDCECMDKSVTELLTPFELIEDCCICHSNEDAENGCKLHCNHAFHKECIHQWVVSSSKTTCPLCRSDMVQCSVCNNTKRQEYIYVGTVIPPELRPELNRNTTEGRYGIYDYDYDDLIIEDMYYCKYSQHLYLKMGVL